MCEEENKGLDSGTNGPLGVPQQERGYEALEAVLLPIVCRGAHHHRNLGDLPECWKAKIKHELRSLSDIKPSL